MSKQYPLTSASKSQQSAAKGVQGQGGGAAISGQSGHNAGAISNTRIVAVTSGKGGVGKTSVSVNLAIALARAGSRVCILDADTGLANINILLGLAPRHTLEHVYSGELSVADIVLHGPGGVDIIPGASGLVSHVNLDAGSQQMLVQGLQSLERHYDYLLIDTAAGISATVLHFVASAQTAMIMITPEPTSLTDAFSLLKVLRHKGYKRDVQVVVNMVADSRQAWRIYERFNAAVKKYIGLQTQWLAAIPRDDAMRRAIMKQKPVALQASASPIAAAFDKMAEMLDQFFIESTVPAAVFSRYWKRVFERVAEKAATALRQTATAAPAVPAAENRATQAGHAEEVLAVDSGEEAEKRWINARRDLVTNIREQRVSNEKLLHLLSELVDASGDMVGHFGADLAYYLLSRCSAEDLTPDQRQLMALELFRLGVRGLSEAPSQGPEQQSQNEPPEILSERPKSPTTPHQDSDDGVRRHTYDEAGFGSQQALLERLRQASSGESLTSLLASAKFSTLVRED